MQCLWSVPKASWCAKTSEGVLSQLVDGSEEEVEGGSRWSNDMLELCDDVHSYLAAES